MNPEPSPLVCPFCGGEIIFGTDDEVYGPNWSMRCPSCTAFSPCFTSVWRIAEWIKGHRAQGITWEEYKNL